MIEKKTNKPKLRFPTFDGDWRLQNVEELFERVKNPVKVVENQEYQQIGIRSHGKGIFYKEKVTGSSLGNKAVFWIEPNVFIVNIVFAWERAVAITSENEVGMIASHRFPMYKPKERLTALKFILYFFKTQRGNQLLIDASPGGAGRNKTLGQKEFGIQKLYVPEYIEQEKIGNFFSKLDERIEVEERKLKLLQQQKKGYMQKIFNQELTFKDQDGNDYPGWEEKKLGEIAEIRTGYTPSRKDKNNFGGDIIWISVADMKTKYIYDTKEYLSRKDVRDAKWIEADTLLMSFKLSIGVLAVTKVKCMSNEAIANFKWENDITNNEYMYAYLSSQDISAYGNNAAQGISLNNASLREIKVLLPCKGEQQKIADFFTAVDQKVESVKNRIELLKEQKTSFMQQMFL